MQFNPVELHQIKKDVKSWVESIRPPENLRALLDIAYRIQGRSIEIFMVQSQWRGGGPRKKEIPTVKISHIHAPAEWRIYCMRVTQKWALYDRAKTLSDALGIVHLDQHGCFFG
ncbi:DUF3024 domain-containing protein [Serratia marcescens]|uniref:DUF3024 domain-containing protein n=1 Tax=Serratia marcescens TaxID=615 RepID=UPI003FA741A5